MPLSSTHMKMPMTATNAKTMPVIWVVSLRVGHDTLDFVVGLAGKAQGATAGFAEPGDHGCDHEAADKDADTGRHRLRAEHGKPDDASNNDKNRQPELDPVGGTGYGFYAGIRHIATRAAVNA